MDSTQNWVMRPNTNRLEHKLTATHIQRFLLISSISGSPEPIAILYNESVTHPGMLTVYAYPDGSVQSQLNPIN